MKYIVILLVIIAGLLPVLANPNDYKTFENQLNPFSYDGCSSFPDAIGMNDWSACCLEHDIKYWVGGTSTQKSIADDELETCVAERTNKAFGKLVRFGVEVGGQPWLPTTWRWGYGWVINRGFKEIGPSEQLKIDAMTAQIPNPIDLEIPPLLPIRQNITGNYCLDIALDKIAEATNTSSIEYRVTSIELYPAAQGLVRNFEIYAKTCDAPYHFQFLLLEQNACTTGKNLNELVANGSIHLLDFALANCPN